MYSARTVPECAGPSLQGHRVPGLDDHHRRLFAFDPASLSTGCDAVPVAANHEHSVDMRGGVADIPVLKWDKIKSLTIWFDEPLQVEATLTIRCGNYLHEYTTQKYELDQYTLGRSLCDHDGTWTQCLHGTVCVRVLDKDGRAPANVQARVTLTYARRGCTLPTQTAREKRVIAAALRSMYLAHAGTLPPGVRVRVSDIDARVREYMSRRCILDSEVELDTWPLASVTTNNAVVDGLSTMPRARAANYDESKQQVSEDQRHCSEFPATLAKRNRTGDVDIVHVAKHDLLYGVRLEPPVDTDDLLLRIGTDAEPIRLSVCQGLARLSRPLLLVLIDFSTVTLEMPGLGAYNVTGLYGTVSDGLRRILRDLPSTSDMDDSTVEVELENGTIDYGHGLAHWAPDATA
jgi:hypothetical protein